MFQPVNIVLVRHGMSEHNLARKRSEAGDDSDWDTQFSNKHTSQYRLTDIGIEQSKICGEYIKNNISSKFDKYFVSEYLRTMETAYYLGFEDSKWEVDFTIRERDKGIFSGLTESEKKEQYKELKRMKKDDFYWSPLGGESVAELCQRVDRFLDLLNKECTGMNVIIVTHGTIMEAFRVRLEKMLHQDYKNIKNEQIKNCQILWYTQRNPETSVISKSRKIKWFKSICPYNDEWSFKNWRKIKSVKYADSDLFKKFSKTKRYVNNTQAERNEICSKNNGCKK